MNRNRSRVLGTTTNFLRLHRAQEEDVTLSADALDVLSRIGSETSLRYSINLIATANLVAKRRKASEVDVVDVRRVYGESPRHVLA